MDIESIENFFMKPEPPMAKPLLKMHRSML